jgi:hypothetical protein
VMLRRLLAVAVMGFVLAAASPAPAGGTVLQFPLFINGLIFFVTSGFSDHPIMLFGRPTAFPVIIQPILLVRQNVFVAPTAIVFLSPMVPFGAPIVPSVPMTAPTVDSAAAANMPPAAVETVDNIARAPELYDERLVSVTGVISGLGTFVDNWGHLYQMFQLVDGYRSIIVLIGGQAANLRSGLRVQVTGVFFSEVASSGGRMTGVLQALAVTGPP